MDGRHPDSSFYYFEFELKTTLNLYCVYMYFNIDWNELEVYNGMLIYTQFVGLVSPLLVVLKDQTKTQFFTLIFYHPGFSSCQHTLKATYRGSRLA